MSKNAVISHWERDVFFGVPTFDAATLEYCRDSDDWMPVAYEWHNYVATLLYRFAEFGNDTDKGLVVRPNRYHAILRGLLVRSAKLMFGANRLISDAKNGDIFIALERMALESMVKCRWLIKKDSSEIFDRFIKSGLKKNVELQTQIEKINKALGGVCNLNAWLQQNLDASFKISGVSASEVRESKEMPKFKQMLDELGLDKNYLYFQSLPSSQVHGDWSDLIANHLEYDFEAERFNLKSAHNEPRARVCFVGTNFAFDTLKLYIAYNIVSEGRDVFLQLVNTTKQEFEELYLRRVLSQDFLVQS